MAYEYSRPERASDPDALPDIEIFHTIRYSVRSVQLRADEVAASEAYADERREFMKRPEFRFAAMNGQDRERMITAMVDELGIAGGWYFALGFPGCLWDSEPEGPYATYAEALEAARDVNGDW